MLTLIRPTALDPEPTPRGPLRRILFVLDGEIYAGIEHGTDPDRIPVGGYELEMATMHRARMRALWVVNTKLFIHAANYADELEGCASPGTASPNGVRESGNAMDRFLRVHGGFKEKRKVPFRCIELNADGWHNIRSTIPRWMDLSR